MTYYAEDRRDDPTYDPGDDRPTAAELAREAMERADARGDTSSLWPHLAGDPF